MELTSLIQRICLVEIKRLMLIITMLISAAVIFQYFTVSSKTIQLSTEDGKYHVFSDISNSSGFKNEVAESSIEYDQRPIDESSSIPQLEGLNSSVKWSGNTDSDRKPTSVNESKKILELHDMNANSKKIQIVSAIERELKKLSVQHISLSQMNSMLTQSSSSSLKLKVWLLIYDPSVKLAAWL